MNAPFVVIMEWRAGRAQGRRLANRLYLEITVVASIVADRRTDGVVTLGEIIHVTSSPLPDVPFRVRMSRGCSLGARGRIVSETGLGRPITGDPGGQLTINFLHNYVCLENIVAQPERWRSKVEVSLRRRIVAGLVFWPFNNREVRSWNTFRGAANIIVIGRIGPDVASGRLFGAADKSRLATPREV